MSLPPSHTLDPDDWPALRALGHRMLDDMFDWLQTVRERPVWVSPPDEVRAALAAPVPFEGQGDAAAYDDFLRLVRPYAAGNLHPRFFGWVKTNGTPLGMLADMLASGLNPLVAGFDQAPALVEAQVVRWMAELMGLPPGSGGLFTTGGSMANLLAVATARHAAAGFDVRETGLQAAGAPQLTVYASTECHSWIDKTVEVMGLGRRGLRRVPVDAAFRLDVTALRQAIAADRARGARPCVVVATAVPSTPAPSTRFPQLRTSAAKSACGSTSTAPSAPLHDWRRRWRRAWPVSSVQTRWRSTCTSGCTSRTSARVCSSVIPPRRGPASLWSPPIWIAPHAGSRPGGCRSPMPGSTSRGGSRP